MNLQYRINLLSRLGEYILSADENWQACKEKAGWENGWFIPEFVNNASENIAKNFLQINILSEWAATYQINEKNENPKKVGIVMAGNIPLVGFHDFLCAFISGHYALLKTSTRDQVLIKHLVEKLIDWEPEVQNRVEFSEMLKGCYAYLSLIHI